MTQWSHRSADAPTQVLPAFAQAQTKAPAPTQRKASFRHRRWLGLPAPVVAGTLALLLAAGAAIAAVMFFARANVGGQVAAPPQISWVGNGTPPEGGNFDGVQPVTLSVAGAPGVLTLAIPKAYAGGSFDLWAYVDVPRTQSQPNDVPPLVVQAIDFGSPSVLAATLGDTAQTGGAARWNTAGIAPYGGFIQVGSVLDPNGMTGLGAKCDALACPTQAASWSFKRFAVQVHVEILEDAPVGDFGGGAGAPVQVPGLQVGLA